MAKIFALFVCLALIALVASQGVQPGSPAAARATADATAAGNKKDGDLQTSSSVFYGLGYGGYGLGYGYGGYGLGYGLGYGYPYYYQSYYTYPAYAYHGYGIYG